VLGIVSEDSAPLLTEEGPLTKQTSESDSLILMQ
jgi:hypothetical protein